MIKNSPINQRRIITWLSAVCVSILIMIFIGGFTRLTDSGLSITEWNPISGVIPPITKESWQIEFEKYKQSPEFVNINYMMTLAEFRYIYLVEFIHRIAARVTGLLLIVPFVFFLCSGYIKRKDIRIYLCAIGLLLAQGAMGWYMVKSGLIANPHVSHFRLSAHLLLAVFLYAVLLWQLFRAHGQFALISVQKSAIDALWWGKLSAVVVMIQIGLGGLVAGLKAGLIYNDFPLMGGSLVPHELMHAPLSFDLFSDPVLIQFLHRNMAYILTIIVAIFCFKLCMLRNLKISKSAGLIALALLLQISSGIFTLMHAVPLIGALIHQLGSVFLLSAVLWSNYLLSTSHKTTFTKSEE